MNEMNYNSKIMESYELFEKKFSVLQDVSSAIVSTDNITAIANLMLDLSINYTNAEKGSVMLANDRDELYILAERGFDRQMSKSYRVKIGQGIAGIVAENRKPMLVQDIAKENLFAGKKARDRYKTRSFISCPILSKQKLLGVININDKKDNTPFTNDEFELIKIIANQAAITLENAFLMNQFKAKTVELENINRRLIELDVLKTEFLTRISHELRTPLNSIKGAIYYLQQTLKIPGNVRKDFHEIISNETDKLVSFIENMLDFLRLEDEVRLTQKVIINIKDLLKEVVSSKLLKLLLIKKNLNMRTDIRGEISDIVGDRIRIVQFFINMIEGLSPFLENGDTIEFVAEEAKDDFVNIKLNLSREMPKTVESFFYDEKQIYITDKADEKAKFYLAKKVADAHGWKIDIENSEKYFMVTINIPKSKKQKIEASVNLTLDMFVEFVTELMELDICSIMLSDEMTGDLRIRSARGLGDDIIQRTKVGFGEKIAGWVAIEGKPLFIQDIEQDKRFEKKASIPQYNSKSLICLPIKKDEKVIGVLNLNNKRSKEPFYISDFRIASLLTERISHLLGKFYSNEYQDAELKQFISSFDSLVNLTKKYQKKDSVFSDLMVKILEELGADDNEKQIAQFISVVYDMGLILMDEGILQKKHLSPVEFRNLKMHPLNTIGLFNVLEFPDTFEKAILHHHEKYDGSGYPDGLKGDEIPFLSNVLAVVDSYCAMVSDRPYRKKMSKEEALDELTKGEGSFYHPKVVAAIRKVLLAFD